MITTTQVERSIETNCNEIIDRLDFVRKVLEYADSNHLTHGEKNGLIKFALTQCTLMTVPVSNLQNMARAIGQNTFSDEPQDLPF